MPPRTEKVVGVAVRAATKAKQWAQAAVREADRLMHEAKRRAESEDRRRPPKQTLLKTGRVLKTAGRGGPGPPVGPGDAGGPPPPPPHKATQGVEAPERQAVPRLPPPELCPWY